MDLLKGNEMRLHMKFDPIAALDYKIQKNVPTYE